MCDDIHKDLTEDMDSTKIWKNQKHAVFKDNKLNEIDKSIKLYPNLVELVLDKNLIESISNLSSLNYLSSLSLRGNRISDVVNWHLLVGNLTKLNLSQNKIKKLEGFSKMYSLVNLDLSGNLIEDINEVDHIGRLPCLENLRLTGNPVACSVGEFLYSMANMTNIVIFVILDYRARVLSRFGDRLQEICLDNERGSQQEIDTALVLSALRISQTKSPIPPVSPIKLDRR